MARVLLMEDSEVIRTMVKTALERRGHAVLMAENGLEGLRLAEAHLPDVVVTDIVMPEMNGFEATRALRKNPATSQIPIIMLTSKSTAADRFWGERQGAFRYLTKPVRFADLEAAIQSALGNG